MPDSQVHRHWLCKAFQASRTVNEAQAQEIAQMMPCIAAHGWMPEPPTLAPFRNALLHLPDETESFVLPSKLPKVLHAFTDGGCLAPTCALGRLASWGVVIANDDMDDFWPVADGLVPGWTQTALRGEIKAAICACQLALRYHKPLVIWTDNDLVFVRLKRFRFKLSFFKPNQKDADLWSRLHSAVRSLGPSLIGIQKVCSHQDVARAENEFEAWAFQGNAAADHVADRAIHRFPEIYTKWQKLQHDITHIHILRNHVHKTLIQVGKHAVRNTPSAKVDKQHGERISREEIAEVDLAAPKVEDIPAKYNFKHVSHLLSWIDQLTDPAEPVKCISWFQLNILFEHQTGQKGVRHVKKKKVWVDGEEDSVFVDFVRRTNYMSDWVQSIWKHCGKPIKLLHLRPESNVLQFWTQCLSIRLRQGLQLMADELLQEVQSRVTSVKSLRTL